MHFTSIAILARLLLQDCRGSYLAPHDAKVDFDVVRDVLRYFTRNPEAADSVEGVARWRLVDQAIHNNLERVARAVAWLVSKELLVEESTSPSTLVVRLNKQRLGQIERFLQQANPEKARRRPPKKKKGRSSKR